MPKVVSRKFNQKTERPSKEKKDEKAAASASAASAASRAFGPLFNKDLGQHILKNPLVAQGIVDKVLYKEDSSINFRTFQSYLMAYDVSFVQRGHNASKPLLFPFLMFFETWNLYIFY